MYNDILARSLAEAGDDVIVWVEKHPGHPPIERLDAGPGKAEVRRIFPHRAGRGKKDFLSYVAYAGANATYLRLPIQIRRASSENYSRVRILLHASFLYHPNIFPALLTQLKKTGVADTELVLDVRDYSLPASRRTLLKRFDKIITSSEGVAEFLGDVGAIPILMPFEHPTVPDTTEVQRVLDRHGLAGKRFLLNPNGLNLAKRSDVIRQSVALLRHDPRFADVILATAGRERNREASDTEAERRGEAVYLGNVSHDELLSLMRAAMFTVILSNREAISRAALEAMAVGGRVLLPDLPEFNRDCASHVISEINGTALALKVAELHERPMPAYRFDLHDAAAFVPQYRDL